MLFHQAASTIMTFGKYKGISIEKISFTDEGLLYLDWLRGQAVSCSVIREALDTYLEDKTISLEIAKTLGKQNGDRY